MNESLYQKLVAYAASDIYPFCMPGHKRQNSFAAETGKAMDPYLLDITEVEGFDDLHRANGILKEITDHAAEIYAGADQRKMQAENLSEASQVKPAVFMSVNGSTACNLAVVNSMPEGTVLIAANCHRSVFNGAKISGRKVIELAPRWVSPYRIYGGIDPEDVEHALCGYPDIRAVVITSPSYEGFVSDVERIAAAVHSHGAYLIVDEAHGAHLPFCEKLPVSALYLGADVVVHSLHKTVGSLNQTALAFVNAEELKEEFHEKLLLFTTTSPSYLLMASIEQAVEWAGDNRPRFDAYCEKLFALRQKLSRLSAETEEKGAGLRVIDKSIAGSYNIFDLDQAKILFAVKGMPGETLYRRFYEEYRLQFEKYGDRYALAMTTVWDTDEGFERLLRAAEDIHRSVLKETGNA